MNIIVFDFEVFKYDTLLGAMLFDGKTDEPTLFQTWNKDQIKAFFTKHENDLWVGHNNLDYDNLILEAIVNNKDPYVCSKRIINSKFRPRCRLKFPTYDLMATYYYSLKMSELSRGRRISETEVDFNLDRPLTDEEKRKTESYNADDLEQTCFNLSDSFSNLSLKLDIVNEFGLPIEALNYTEARTASTVLGAKQIPGIENWYIKPEIYDTLQVKNKDVLDFYLSEGFRQGKRCKVQLCGVEHTLGAGGIHAAVKNVYIEKAMYLDVSGYYNLVMLLYDLLPRTVPKEGKQLYDYMYHQQLALKKTDPRKRWVYKTILLSVFGAMMNEHTDFYDPQRGSLVTMTGQMFLVDLLEKLEGHGQLIQSNTDGIMFVPDDWSKEEDVWEIVRSWCRRTGFVIKEEHIYKLFQKDVNNYCYYKGSNFVESAAKSLTERIKDVNVKGTEIGSYDKPIDQSTAFKLWELKEPKIIAQGVTDYLMFGISPEQVVDELKMDFRYFQYACKKLSYDYCEYETVDKDGNKNVERLQNVNRAFASCDSRTNGMVYKVKDRDSKHSRAKVACLPSNVFVWNDEILSDEAKLALSKKIDYQYYVDRIYQKIAVFLGTENE